MLKNYCSGGLIQQRLMKLILTFCLLCFSNTVVHGQISTAKIDSAGIEPLNTRSKRLKTKLVIAGHIITYGTALAGLYHTWYKGSSFGHFRFVNDNKKWLQMDKAGHAWAGYMQGRFSIAAWRWVGVDERKAIWKGAITGFAFQNLVEILDGFSGAWGFSWGDYIADVAGSGLLMSQELAWKEQRILFKFSTHRNHYKEAAMEERANDIYGSSLGSRLLDDYNAQTYWLSLNLKSLSKMKFPSWLNLAVGYGAHGMFGDTRNSWEMPDGTTAHMNTKRLRQFYLSPDIDLSKIQSRSALMRTLLFVLNSCKVPAPTLELSGGKTKFHWILF